MTYRSPHGTMFGREMWHLIVRRSRNVVAAHADDAMCDRCAGPGDCHLLRSAEGYLADPEMLAAEREALS
ncbi:hypothetical protein BDK92_1727 [Micromonospora pisi]|uniref:Uncharacterized protein n=1 Tax=Micromonospora pisi TaxID=589240 RepID=A0A495JFE6_9ACTN|nr:hypothetical protein [Micromonospora pisi]RKR87451.1 hypothetical protein BDK92_1727 [Micromonospora pisi]